MTRNIDMVKERKELLVHHSESAHRHYMGDSYCSKKVLNNKLFQSCFIGFIFFPVVISNFIYTPHMGLFPSVPRFFIYPIRRPRAPGPPPSFQPFFFHRLKSVVVRVSSDRDDWRFQYTPTDKVITPALYSIVFKSVMSYSAGQYSLLWDERASLCDVIFKQSHYYTGLSVKERRPSNLVRLRKGWGMHTWKRQHSLYMYIYMYKYIWNLGTEKSLRWPWALYLSHCVDI